MPDYEITGDPAADAKSYIDLSRADHARYLEEHPEAKPIPESEFLAAEAKVRKHLEALAALRPKLPELDEAAAAPGAGGEQPAPPEL